MCHHGSPEPPTPPSARTRGTAGRKKKSTCGKGGEGPLDQPKVPKRGKNDAKKQQSPNENLLM